MSDVAGAQDAPSDAEREARNLGWVGKEEFKGDPAKWRPAEEFLDRGKRILPIVLKDNERLQRNLDRVKDELKELRDSTKQLVEFHTTAAKREYERGRREIEAKIEAAAANADQSAVRAGMQELDALAKQNAPTPAVSATNAAPQVDPAYREWNDREGHWCNQGHPTLWNFALETEQKILRDHPGMGTSERLAEVKRRTVEKFPEQFGINPNRAAPAAVGDPSGAGGAPKNKSKHTYENLPAEAKAACDKLCRSIKDYSKEKYCADYQWDD